ncbi:MAG: polysaccharide deacetylase family protein [Reichenbachiella sp.]|uniref:polysaccharide deacetylase family protein n=1 Tax=Reichenbachiella sp. TaxID=2184521 RepID=UPI003297D95B
MGFYFHRIPSLFQKLFTHHIWTIPNSSNEIYLTFDDGPTPKVSEQILHILAEYNVVGTFFCLGKNLKNQERLIEKMYTQGHQLANHGFEHLDGWKISKEEYFDNQKRGEQTLNEYSSNNKIAFRPPYGHFRGGKSAVLWSLMSGDFDDKLSKEECLSQLISKTKSGDIIVFHDNEKSFDTLKWVLPKFLDFCKEQGFTFGVIPNSL